MAEFCSLPVAELERLQCIKGRIPLLRSFALVHPEDFWGVGSIERLPVYERFSGAFEQSPSLIRLQLSDTAMMASSFHWNSIESLQLRLLTDVGKLVATLSQAQRIRSWLGRRVQRAT